MRRAALVTRLACASALAALCAAAPAAHAGYFPGQTADGPSAEIQRVAGIGLARDGGGAVAYEKAADGANHVFASLLVHGNPLPPERVDVGQPGGSADAQLAVADTGRLLVAWINGGRVWASLRPDAGQPFGAPVLVYEPGAGEEVRDLSLGLTLHGVGYLTFTSTHPGGSDVRAAVFNRGEWMVYPSPLDIEPGRNASGARVAASADGSALAAWTEGGRVFVRRLARTRLSSFTAEASLGEFAGHRGLGADSPSLDIEDDSSYAWIAFRQEFDEGGTVQSRVVARRLRGDVFGEPYAADAQGFPASEGGERPDVDVTGRGRALVAARLRASLGTVGATIRDDAFEPSEMLGPAGPPSRPVAAMAETGRGTIAWWREPGELIARYYTSTRWEPEAVLSAPEFGLVDASAGIDASGDTEGNQAVAFIQGTGAERRLVVAVYDKAPRAVGGSNSTRWKRRVPRRITWGGAPDRWGGVRFRVDVDGLPVFETTGQAWRPSRSLGDGAHAYSVVSIDSRGQETYGPEREFRVDTTDPKAKIGPRRLGRSARLRLRAHDGGPLAGSGVRHVVIRWGDGRSSVIGAPAIGEIQTRARHRYRKRGSYRIRAVVYDRAGNVGVKSRRVRVR